MNDLDIILQYNQAVDLSKIQANSYTSLTQIIDADLTPLEKNDTYTTYKTNIQNAIAAITAIPTIYYTGNTIYETTQTMTVNLQNIETYLAQIETNFTLLNTHYTDKMNVRFINLQPIYTQVTLSEYTSASLSNLNWTTIPVSNVTGTTTDETKYLGQYCLTDTYKSMMNLLFTNITNLKKQCEMKMKFYEIVSEVFTDKNIATFTSNSSDWKTTSSNINATLNDENQFKEFTLNKVACDYETNRTKISGYFYTQEIYDALKTLIEAEALVSINSGAQKDLDDYKNSINYFTEIANKMYTLYYKNITSSDALYAAAKQIPKMDYYSDGISRWLERSSAIPSGETVSYIPRDLAYNSKMKFGRSDTDNNGLLSFSSGEGNLIQEYYDTSRELYLSVERPDFKRVIMYIFNSIFESDDHVAEFKSTLANTVIEKTKTDKRVKNMTVTNGNVQEDSGGDVTNRSIYPIHKSWETTKLYKGAGNGARTGGSGSGDRGNAENSNGAHTYPTLGNIFTESSFFTYNTPKSYSELASYLIATGYTGDYISAIHSNTDGERHGYANWWAQWFEWIIKDGFKDWYWPNIRYTTSDADRSEYAILSPNLKNNESKIFSTLVSVLNAYLADTKLSINRYDTITKKLIYNTSSEIFLSRYNYNNGASNEFIFITMEEIIYMLKIVSLDKNISNVNRKNLLIRINSGLQGIFGSSNNMTYISGTSNNNTRKKCMNTLLNDLLNKDVTDTQNIAKKIATDCLDIASQYKTKSDAANLTDSDLNLVDANNYRITITCVNGSGVQYGFFAYLTSNYTEHGTKLPYYTVPILNAAIQAAFERNQLYYVNWNTGSSPYDNPAPQNIIPTKYYFANFLDNGNGSITLRTIPVGSVSTPDGKWMAYNFPLPKHTFTPEFKFNGQIYGFTPGYTTYLQYNKSGAKELTYTASYLDSYREQTKQKTVVNCSLIASEINFARGITTLDIDFTNLKDSLNGALSGSINTSASELLADLNSFYNTYRGTNMVTDANTILTRYDPITELKTTQYVNIYDNAIFTARCNEMKNLATDFYSLSESITQTAIPLMQDLIDYLVNETNTMKVDIGNKYNSLPDTDPNKGAALIVKNRVDGYYTTSSSLAAGFTTSTTKAADLTTIKNNFNNTLNVEEPLMNGYLKTTIDTIVTSMQTIQSDVNATYTAIANQSPANTNLTAAATLNDTVNTNVTDTLAIQSGWSTSITKLADFLEAKNNYASVQLDKEQINLYV